MLRLLRRHFSKLHINQTLSSLSLNVKAEKEEVPTVKKKVKFSLNNEPSGKIDRLVEILKQIDSLPSNAHEIPEEFEKLNQERDSTFRSIKSVKDRYQGFINGMLTIPKEGVHYYEKTRLTQGDGLDSLQVRTYISGMVRNFKNEGVQFGRSVIPDAALKPHDEKMIKYYTKVDENGKILDYNHWANWYLKNQPEDILSLEDSEWEPLDVNYERMSDMEGYYSMVDKKERNSGPRVNDNEKSFKDRKGGSSDVFQADVIDEFMEREYDFLEEAKKLPLQAFLESKDVNFGTFYSPMDNSSLLPPSPPTLKMDYVGFNNDIESWGVFRAFPTAFKNAREMAEMDEKFKTDKEWVPVKIPSILNYYETLPNYHKSHRLIQAVTLILEKYHPKVARKQKELLINRLCNILTPKNPEKLKFLQEYYNPPKGGKPIGIESEVEKQMKDPNPRKYKIESEGEIEILGTQLFSDSDIDPEIRAKIEEKKKNWKEGDSDTVDGPLILIKDGKYPEKLLKKHPNIEKENKEMMDKIIKQIYPGSDVEFEGLQENVEGTVGDTKWKKYRHKHKNLTRGDSLELAEGETHLKLPEGYEPESAEEDIVSSEVDEADVGSEIEMDIDKTTGAIKEMYTSKKLDYDKKRHSQHAGGVKESLASMSDEEGDSDAESEEGSDDDDDDKSGPNSEDDDLEVSSDDNFIDKEEEKSEDDSQSDSEDEDDEENEKEGDNYTDDDSDKGDSDSLNDSYKESGDESGYEDDDDLDSDEENTVKKPEDQKDLSPEDQLKKAMGQSKKKKVEESVEFNIVDRNINWFERNHENSDGLIPSVITFYDNNDGYWDHWIKTKRERAGLPEIGSRPYFR